MFCGIHQPKTRHVSICLDRSWSNFCTALYCTDLQPVDILVIPNRRYPLGNLPFQCNIMDLHQLVGHKKLMNASETESVRRKIEKLKHAKTLKGCGRVLTVIFSRNYLRRSRHLRSEILKSSSFVDDDVDNYDEPNLGKVTSKEILSFAWQICNGMAYLSDIKVSNYEEDEVLI